MGFPPLPADEESMSEDRSSVAGVQAGPDGPTDGQHSAGEVRAAIRGLTKVQRRFVKDGCIHGDFTMATVRALLGKGLFHVVPRSPNGRWGPALLTPLGEAARAAIQNPQPSEAAPSGVAVTQLREDQ